MKAVTRKCILILEMIGIFILLPCLYYFDIFPGHKSIPLLIVFLLLLFALIYSKSFDNKRFRMNNFKGWKCIFIRFVIITLLLLGYVFLFENEFLFFIPRNNIFLWLMIMIFYPLWSAYTQELIFRAYFFYRYKDLIKNQTILIVLNALLFAFMHFIFNSWVAIVLSFFAGLMFALTYIKSKSLLVVAIEHALYGNLINTIGLGHYFYVPDF